MFAAGNWEHVNPHTQAAEQATAAVTDRSENGIEEEMMEVKAELIGAADCARDKRRVPARRGPNPPRQTSYPCRQMMMKVTVNTGNAGME